VLLLVAGVNGKHGGGHKSHASDASPNSNIQKYSTDDGTVGSASVGSAKDDHRFFPILIIVHPSIPDELPDDPDDLLIGHVPEVGNPAVGIQDDEPGGQLAIFLDEHFAIIL
jgi:hypothetical protein